MDLRPNCMQDENNASMAFISSGLKQSYVCRLHQGAQSQIETKITLSIGICNRST